MVIVRLNKTVRYNGETRPANVDFEIKEKDLKEMQRLGAFIVEAEENAAEENEKIDVVKDVEAHRHVKRERR